MDRKAVLISSCLAGILAVALAAAPEPAASSLLITGARVLDVRTGAYVPAAGVLVEGRRITAILSALPAALPNGAQRLDLAGATLVPGLGDMYATAAPDASVDADFYYAMALAHGVTMYRTVGAPLPWAASQRARSTSGDIVAPRLWVGGAMLDQQGPPGFSTRRVPDVVTARREVLEQSSLGADWVTVSSRTDAEMYRVIVRSAHSARMRVSGQAGTVSTAQLFTIGVDAVDGLAFLTKTRDEIERTPASGATTPQVDPQAMEDEAWQLPAPVFSSRAARPAGRCAFLVPMLGSFNGILAGGLLKGDVGVTLLPERWRNELVARAHPAAWPGADRAGRAAENRTRAVRDLVAAGVRLVTGVDVHAAGYNVPGAGVHRELALLVAAGLTPADAIRAATMNCAEMVGAESTLGQIRPGFAADFIAVDGDPLRDIGQLQRIRLIVKGGEVLDRGMLLGQARRAGRAPLSSTPTTTASHRQ
ncbi:MAG TPA: amidohydrolase family protein [Vicinamibacterales bacterium]|jgi:hypothetical protein